VVPIVYLYDKGEAAASTVASKVWAWLAATLTTS
jgi:hypothetical protein